MPLKTPAQMTYEFAREELNKQFDNAPGVFIPEHDCFLSPTLIGEWLIDKFNAHEEDAFEWAAQWLDEPHVNPDVDPIMQ